MTVESDLVSRRQKTAGSPGDLPRSGMPQTQPSSRVVHTIATITPHAGGPTYSVTRLCEALLTAGRDVELLALDAGSIQVKPGLVRFFAYGLGPERLGRSPDMCRWLDAETAAGRIGLIHTHGLWMMPNVYTGWVARRYNTPLVVSPRGTLTRYSMASGSWVKRYFWPLVQKPALRPVVCFHATCEAEYHDIRRLGFRQPVAVIPNGIDELPAVSLQARPERTVLYLGRIHPEKGVEELLRAWALIEGGAAGWRLRMVGTGSPDYVALIKALASSLGLSRIEFSDALYGEAKQRAYGECDVYAMYSLGDNFAMTVAEALMAGRPVITTTGAPWGGLVSRGAGWWTPMSIEAFAAALREATSLTHEQIQRMGRAGREWMISDFSWKMVGANMHSLYDWLLAGSVRPSFVISD